MMRIKYMSIVVVLIILFSFVVTASAGDPDSGSAPGSTSSYTLEDIYNRLDAGTAGAKSTFTEPAAGPGSTMHTLDEIYDLTGERAFVPKTGAGNPPGYVEEPTEDGNPLMRKGVAWPNPRFTDNNDGTVTDNLTGLIWLEDADCPNAQLHWHPALAFAGSLYDGWNGDPGGGDCDLEDDSIAGDWRLPNVRELQSLIHYGVDGPAVPDTAGTGSWSAGDPFTNIVSTSYWSSTTLAGGDTNAWLVDMFAGGVTTSAKALVQPYYVWPVRGGQ